MHDGTELDDAESNGRKTKNKLQIAETYFVYTKNGSAE